MRPLAFIKGLLKPDSSLKLYLVEQAHDGRWRLAWARPGGYAWEWAQPDIEAPTFANRTDAIVWAMAEMGETPIPVSRYSADPFPETRPW